MTPSMPGVRLPLFVVTRRTARSLAGRDLTRMRWRRCTLAQRSSWTAFAIRTCSCRTSVWTSTQSMDFHPAAQFEKALTSNATRCSSSLRQFLRPQAISQRGTSWKSARFRAGQIPNPYPPHYRTAFACSRILPPHPLGRHLRSAYLRSARTSRNDPGLAAGSVP